MKFGRLRVLYRADDLIGTSGRKRPAWMCGCECGNKKVIPASNLTRGVTKSCGCLAKELMSKRTKTHGGWANNDRLYEIWHGMKRRCMQLSYQSYPRYGGRGITICDEWLDYAAFRNWAYTNGYDENADFGACTLDRIDVNGNYEPSNCRWANAYTQQNNKTSNINITYDGETHSLKEWSRIRGINYETLYSRYKRNWKIARMLNYCD